MSSAPDLSHAIYRAQSDPVWFTQHVLGDEPWSMQSTVLNSVRDNRETAVASCHGAGKSYIAARAVLWFLYSFVPSIVITTAPTDRQVKKILWKEIAMAHARARYPLGGRVLQQEIQITPEWWALGFTTRDYDPDRFQGFHEAHVLAVVDEAAGVTSQIYDGIKGILSNEHARGLYIGNPTNPDGYFGHSFRRGGQGKFNISALDTPNFTAFGITLDDIANNTWQDKITGELPAPKLVTPQWLADAYHDQRPGWGPQGPLFIAKGLGRFPEGSPDALIQLSWLNRCESRRSKKKKPIQLALDVARYGDDENVLALRTGDSVKVLRTWSGINTMATTGRAAKAMDETKAECIKVDTVGVGGGVADRLIELGYPVVEMGAGESADDGEQYANKRSEWFGDLSVMLEHAKISIDHDPELRAQLTGLKRDFDSSGRMVLESKKKAKARGVPSPDRADAIAMVMSNDGAMGLEVL